MPKSSKTKGETTGFRPEPIPSEEQGTAPLVPLPAVASSARTRTAPRWKVARTVRTWLPPRLEGQNRAPGPGPVGRLYPRLPRNRSFSLSCAFTRRGPQKWSKFGPGTPVQSASHGNQADHRQHAHPLSPFARFKPFEVAHRFAVALVQLNQN